MTEPRHDRSPGGSADDPMLHDTDRLLAEWLRDAAPAREPALLAPSVIARTALTRRRSRWLVRDWWRDLLSGRGGSPLVPLIAATAVLAVLVLVGVGLLRFTATEDAWPDHIPGGAIIVPDEDGAGLATIGEAIAIAEPGSTIAVLPGEYRENLVIDKPLTLIGWGEADEAVIGPADADVPVIVADADQAELRRLTLEGPGGGVVLRSGTFVLDDLILRDVGEPRWRFTGADWEERPEGTVGITVDLDADATITDSRLEGGGAIEVNGSSTVRIERNELRDGPIMELFSAAPGSVVRDNTITDSGFMAIVSGPSQDLIVENNVISQRDPGVGIFVFDVDGEIRDNVIEGANVGVRLEDRTSATVSNNQVDASGVALELHGPAAPAVVGNDLCGGNAIVALVGDAAAPDLSDNDLCEGVPEVFDQ
jgi:hypothetical protein